jgi:hypothetical protein
MYSDDLEPEEWKRVVERSIWLHLAKLQSSGAQLGAAAAHNLATLSAAYPDWRVAEDERDEFAVWSTGTGDPGYEESRDVDVPPRKRVELVAWLKRRPHSQHPFYEDTWREVCRSRFFRSAVALCDLAREREWPSDRWGQALQAWSDEGHVARSWRFVAPVVQMMPDDKLKDTAYSIAWWLAAVSKALDRHENIFLDLCRRILAVPHGDGLDTDQPVTRAINHPVGHVTQALLNLWFKRNPNDNDRLPTDFEPFFTQLCDTAVSPFRHGRVLLASRVIAFFRVDPTWCADHLLPLFDWTIDAVEDAVPGTVSFGRRGYTDL